MSHRTQAELPLFIPTVMTPQGDGSYVCRPGRPVRDLTPAQVAAALGISRSAVYALVDSGRLPCRRPTRRKILISAEAVEEFRIKTRDPEYWKS